MPAAVRSGYLQLGLVVRGPGGDIHDPTGAQLPSWLVISLLFFLSFSFFVLFFVSLLSFLLGQGIRQVSLPLLHPSLPHEILSCMGVGARSFDRPLLNYDDFLPNGR
jgi:hypothetical protein